MAIGIQVRMTYRVGQHCPCRGLRCSYRAFEDCHVVELLAMTNGRALLPLAYLRTVNNVRGQHRSYACGPGIRGMNRFIVSVDSKQIPRSYSLMLKS